MHIDSGVVTQSCYGKRASPGVSQPCWDLESLTSSSHWGRVCGLRGQERWQISKSFDGNSTVCVSCTWYKRNASQICGKGAMGIPANGASVSICLSLSAEEMAIHSSILAWETPWAEEPGRLQPMGSRRIRHNLVTKPPPPPH